jgi:PAS domain S-box-containing protein
MDVTDAKRAAEALRASEERYRTLVEASSAVVWSCPPSGLHVEPQPSWMAFTGQTAEEMLGDGWTKVVHPDDAAAAARRWSEAVAEGRAFTSEHRIRRHDGAWRWMDVHAAPVRDAEGRIVEWSGMNFDITERKQVEDALRESEKRFRALVSATNDVVYRMNPDWTKMQHLEGRAVIADTNAPSRTWLEKYIHPDDRSHVMAAIDRAIQSKTVFELEHRVIRTDGSLGWTLSRAIPVLDATGEILEWFGVASDVTDRKQAEAALCESEERFRALAENMSQLAWMADDQGRRYWYNQRWYDYTGTTLDEMQGWGWTKVHDPEHVDLVVKRIRSSWATGEPWEDTFRLRSRDGEYRWFLSRAMPIRDDAGRIVRWFGTNTDITEQRAAEEALRHADQRKDEFLATLAHELRNPLAPIRQAAALSQMPTATSAQVRWSLELIDRQVKHMAMLLDDLLDVARFTRGRLALNRTRVKASEIVLAAVEMTRPHIEGRAHVLEIALPEEPLVVHGDSMRLAQVIANLLTNAAKYTDPGGRIRVSARKVERHAELLVADNGIGIASEQLERVFEMFSQGAAPAHLTAGGLGIGLSLSRGLVELHGGSLEARSAGIGHGSTFVVRLPLLEETSASLEERPHPLTGALGPRRVLVVDDNVDAADSLALLVQLEGHEVLTAYDGETALSKAASFRPHVVLLDLGMPGIDGYETARRMRAMRSGAEMLLVAVTGWGQEDDRRRTAAAGFDHHLVKPLEVATLNRVIGEAAPVAFP